MRRVGGRRSEIAALVLTTEGISSKTSRPSRPMATSMAA